VFPESVSSLLCYTLMRMDAKELQAIGGVSEGLEMRIKQAAAEGRSFSDIAEGIKTKRYLQARINRILTKVLLGVTRKDESLEPAYARILGIGEKGREVLRQLQRTTKIPIITKAADASFTDAGARRMFSIDLLATDVYTLLYPEKKAGKNGLDFYRSPVVIKKDESV
ncbi:MAG: nucleotidyltransferase family protein, partial [Ruminococcaceae bacterium]|nr:nucleotidyltransferase family protein [Oscillospiraceae bacterium]